MTAPRTLYDKIWDSHLVDIDSEGNGLLYIDLHLVHEVTSPQAFAGLKAAGRKVRRPDRTVAVPDHNVPTTPDRAQFVFEDEEAKIQVETLDRNAREFGVNYYPMNDINQGIVHIVGPEQGYTQPGMTIVCGDSHTATHGAFGALAFGIGTTEVGHVLATQCLLQRKPKSMRVHVTGRPGPNTSAKDIILAVIAKIGVDGGTGHVLEYCGDAINALDMEGRMTLCNMSIEAGARAGLVAPDEKTFAFLKGRNRAPQGAEWNEAIARWRDLYTDEGAHFDREVVVDVEGLRPMITWGTAPDTGIALDDVVPAHRNDSDRKAADYMGVAAGERVSGQKVNRVFIGSCTNSRISDLRAAANIMRGRAISPGVTALVVPGSVWVKAAEEEGLDKVFKAAGAEWREAGCSMCIAMNGDKGAPGELIVSTSNRNFEGRQGPGVRTMLASPAVAAASAVTGRVTDPAKLKEAEYA